MEKKTKPSYKIQENDIITVIPEEIREVELKSTRYSFRDFV